jgi:hypothetical protein
LPVESRAARDVPDDDDQVRARRLHRIGERARDRAAVGERVLLTFCGSVTSGVRSVSRPMTPILHAVALDDRPRRDIGRALAGGLHGPVRASGW